MKSDLATTYTKTEFNSSLALKSDLATTYTKTEVNDKIASVVGSAQAVLDTLNELATALNNDASYSSTIINALAAKIPLASPTFTGAVAGITKRPWLI